ncbi:MAG TPA: hypothetical protein VI386_18380 [Candidatus Sulfotelmatobacter sp.]
MISILFTWLIIAWGAVACIYMLRHAWTRFPRRDFDDVVHFLYPVDLSLAESLLDPAKEFEVSWKLTPREFHAAQRKRMRVYLELVRRMSHNSKVLVEFGNAEMNRQDPRSAEHAKKLQHKAIEVRLYAVLTLCKLRAWMWMRPAFLGQAPAMPKLRRAGDLDGLESYDSLKAAAAAAFVHLQPGELELLTRSL